MTVSTRRIVILAVVAALMIVVGVIWLVASQSKDCSRSAEVGSYSYYMCSNAG